MANIVILTGNLGRDPEEKHTKSESTLAVFPLAFDSGRDETGWVSVACWGRVADSVLTHLSKGDKVMIQGELLENSWTDKESGQTKKTLSVRAYRVEFLRVKSWQQDGGKRAPRGRGAPDGGGDSEMPFDEEDPWA